MTAVLQNVTHTCFGLSYLLAFALELASLRWHKATIRIVGFTLGAVGLVTHSIYLALKHPTPATAYGALLALAWVLAVFYLYGALHYRRQAWAVFVLPLVLVLVLLSFLLISDSPDTSGVVVPDWAKGHRFWGAVHGVFVLLAAVGISVGAVVSAMYLLQARRLRRKLNPLAGMKLLSLERLEQMNRRAVNFAFPLLTVGLLLGAVLLKHYDDFLEKLLSPKILGTLGLWLVFLLLLYLRYATHVSGRRLAWFTIVTFLVMLGVLVASHPFAGGEVEKSSQLNNAQDLRAHSLRTYLMGEKQRGREYLSNASEQYTGERKKSEKASWHRHSCLCEQAEKHRQECLCHKRLGELFLVSEHDPLTPNPSPQRARGTDVEGTP